MENIINAIAPYNPALIGLALLSLAVLVQGFLAGALGLAQSDEVPGKPLKGDHPDFTFRVIRTHANGTENHSVFAATVLLALLAGVAPAIVNWLVAAHVAARLLYWPIYYRGMGKPGGGIRTIVYVLGLLANVALAAVTLYALAT